MPGEFRGAPPRCCRGLVRVRVVIFAFAALTVLLMKAGPGAQGQTPATHGAQGTSAPAAPPENHVCSCTRAETLQAGVGGSDSPLHWLYNQLFQFLLLAFLLLAGLEIILQKAIPVAQRWNEFIDTCRRKTAAQTAPAPTVAQLPPAPAAAKQPGAPAAPSPKASEPAPTAAPPKSSEAPAPAAITPELVGAETSQ